MDITTAQIVLGLLLGYFLFNLLVLRTENRLLGLANSWLRWLLFGVMIASLFASEDTTMASTGFWRLAGAAFLFWFLIETVYNWVLIAAVNRSGMPLFPRFKINPDGDPWPRQSRFELLRQWLRSRGFRKVQSLRTQLMEEMSLYSNVYLSEDSTVLLTVLLVPKRGNTLHAYYTLSTLTQEGERVITDNTDIASLGYYPENWFVERRPLLQSLEKLLNLHKRRLLRGGVNVKPWNGDLDFAEEINEQQQQLERVNVEAGYIGDRMSGENSGRLTNEGRYRLWKEMWQLKYLGRPLS